MSERVLVVHNAYQQRGGEDSVVAAEVKLLQDHGHQVQLFSRDNRSIDGPRKGALAVNTLWSRSSFADFRASAMNFRPDVVHVHNTFPLVSPSVYWAARELEIPVVQTLHNFRLLCPQAMFLRDGRVCEDCLGKLPLSGMVHGCYQGSRARTSVLGGMLMLHRAMGTWSSKIDCYIALNEFCKRKFVEGGLPERRIVIKPNFVESLGLASSPRSGFAFVGRVSSDKGVDTLREALLLSTDDQLTLRVAGSGPLESRVASVAGIEMLGHLDGARTMALMNESMALVVPSLWYENFPRVIVEAYACGLPVIASRIGALAEVVEEGVTGLLFEPGNADDLRSKLLWARSRPAEMMQMGVNARRKFEREFTPERNYEQLVSIYRRVIASRVEGDHE